MADKQISQLTAASALNDADLLVIQQSGVAKKLTGKKLKDYAGGNSDLILVQDEEPSEEGNKLWVEPSEDEFVLVEKEEFDDLADEVSAMNAAAASKALIAPELGSMTADTNLVANDFRIVDNILYKITANIASGGTLVPETNCTVTTIAAEITALLNA